MHATAARVQDWLRFSVRLDDLLAVLPVGTVADVAEA
jgi:hypothetical protein